MESPLIKHMYSKGGAHMQTTNFNYVNDVLKHLYDSCNGLRECAKQVKSASFEKELIAEAEQREIFANELKTLLKNSDVQYEHSGSVAGPLHRLFIDIKSLFTNGDKEAIKKEIKRGDEVLIDSYRSALEQASDTYFLVLQKQLDLIENSPVPTTIM